MYTFYTFLVKPRVHIDPSTAICKMAHQVRFTCHVYGTPRPSVTWMRNGEILQHQGRIKVYGTTGGDWGVYILSRC